MSLKEGSQGTYTWNIDAELLNKTINAKNCKAFSSDVFTIGELNWQIVMYPNGFSKERMGSFDVSVQLLSLPTLWESVIINSVSQSPQTKSSFTSISIYKESGDTFSWRTNTLRLEEIKQLNINHLIFIIKIQILRITLKDNKILYNYQFNNIKHQQLIWHLDKQTLSLARKAYNGKRFESKIFNNMWCIRLAPNGHNKDYIGKCMIM
eukprot:549798_1